MAKCLTKELEKKITEQQEDTWRSKFEKLSQYVGNDIYRIGRLHSTDTRELFLMFVANMENIDYMGKVEEIENEVE